MFHKHCPDWKDPSDNSDHGNSFLCTQMDSVVWDPLPGAVGTRPHPIVWMVGRKQEVTTGFLQTLVCVEGKHETGFWREDERGLPGTQGMAKVGRSFRNIWEISSLFDRQGEMHFRKWRETRKGPLEWGQGCLLIGWRMECCWWQCKENLWKKG